MLSDFFTNASGRPAVPPTLVKEGFKNDLEQRHSGKVHGAISLPINIIVSNILSLLMSLLMSLMRTETFRGKYVSNSLLC
jgi:hypothetical protein